MLLINGSLKAYEIAKSGTLVAGVAKKKTWQKRFIAAVRMWGFPLLSVVFRWPLWVAVAIIRLFIKFDYIFTVYPGTESDLRGYCHPIVAKTRFIHSKPSLVGIISRGEKVGRGLILAIPNVMAEFREKKDTCLEVLGRLAFIRKISGTKAIALAGQLPGVCVRHELSLDKPFVRGNKGTVFCVMETLAEAMRKHKLSVGQARVAIVGVGYVGSLLFDAMKAEGHDVIGVDIEFRKSGVALKEDGEVLLRIADIVVVLTPKGSDFLPYLCCLRKDAIIIDDTHPKIKEESQPEGMFFYKVAVGMTGVKFYPPIPGYKADWLPGCAVEAIIASATGEFNGCSQQEFNRRAKELGFFVHLVR